METIDDIRQLLLISNSTLHGSGYLDHAEREIRDFVEGRTTVIFVPYAVHDRRVYAAKAQERFREMGLSLTSIHDVSNMPRAIDEAEVIFVGGGNTFRLLKGLHDPRAEKITDAGMPVPASRGLATALNFQPTGTGKAAITGDFVLLGSEVNSVIKALRQNGIQVTALHSHMLQEEPRLFFMHFWANDDAVKLAKGLRAALDNTNSTK